MMLRFYLLLAIVFFAFGCISLTKKAQLEEMTKMYARALQGGDQSELLNFVHPESQQQFMKNALALKGLQFSGVEVKKIFPDEKLNSAIVLMNLEYYSLEDPSLLASVRQFNWAYDQQAKLWLLKDPSPFGSRQ